MIKQSFDNVNLIYQQIRTLKNNLLVLNAQHVENPSHFLPL